MKIRLQVSDESREKIQAQLEKAGFAISDDDDAQFVLSEKDLYLSHLSVRNQKGERIYLQSEDIIYMESYGHNIDVITRQERYSSSDPLKRMLELLDPADFTRISNSVIINRKHLKEIIPSFAMKFRLKMDNGDTVEVTRSFYNSFRDFLGI